MSWNVSYLLGLSQRSPKVHVDIPEDHNESSPAVVLRMMSKRFLRGTNMLSQCAPLVGEAVRAQQGPQVREGSWSPQLSRLQGLSGASPPAVAAAGSSGEAARCTIWTGLCSVSSAAAWWRRSLQSAALGGGACCGACIF